MTQELPDEVEVIEGAPMEVEETSFLHSVTSQTPWWIVSILLHTLLIAFAGLVSMAIVFDEDTQNLIVETTIFEQKRPFELPEVKNPRTSTGSPLQASYEKENIDGQDAIVTIQGMINDAVIAKEFATDNRGKEFEQLGAYGNPDAKVFYDRHGIDDLSGGGGRDGTSLSDDFIGSQGAGMLGSGGGRFGGRGTGDGPNEGSGRGTFGWRNRGNHFTAMVPFMGRPRARETEDAVVRALRWLAYHQETDGHWDSAKFGSSQKTDTAVTALSLLALLGSGHTEKVGEHKVYVQRAVAWLKSKQDEKGMIWDRTDACGHRGEGYPCAIATLAIAEAAGMANIPDTRAAAQRAIDYCVNIHQAGEGSDKLGWRYAAKSEGDLSVTGWFIMALKSAKVAGLKVDQAAFQGAIHFLEKCEIKEPGIDPAYTVSKFKYMANNEHAQTAHRLTAIGTLARQFLGWSNDDTRGSVEWFMNKGGVPSFGANGESVDLYYWYYGSMSVFQSDKALFTRWCDGLLGALLPTQCKTGDNAGSWNPAGDYSAEWGRVGQTALSALSLEVFWRWPRIHDQR